MRTISITAVGVGLLAVAGWYGYRYIAGGQERGPAEPPAAVVAAAAAERQNWPERLSAVGTVQATEGIDVTAQLAGVVDEIAFEAGQEVGAGDLLVRLDTATEEAAKRSLEAELAQARIDEERARELAATGAVPQADLDRAVTRRRSLEAQVSEQAALIDKKVIEAPFAGTLGIRRVSPGQLIEPGTPIVTLQSISPIFVNFTLPEQAYADVEAGQDVMVEVAAWPDRVFEGQITAINPKVSEQSRSFTVQALLPNDDRALRPGMFADVAVDLGESREVVAVPATAVTYNAYGESVFLVEESDSGLVARRTFIETGGRRGNEVEVIEGLRAGERVVTAGQVKLSDGFPVEISEQDTLEGVDPRPTEP